MEATADFINAARFQRRVVRDHRAYGGPVTHSQMADRRVHKTHLGRRECSKGDGRYQARWLATWAMIQVVRPFEADPMLAFNASIEATRAGAAGLASPSSHRRSRIFRCCRIRPRCRSAAASRSRTGGPGEPGHDSRPTHHQGDERLQRHFQCRSELTENLQKLFSHQRDTLTKVQYENEQMAEPIMQMIGSIQFQDVLKQRLQAIVHCFEKITGCIENSVTAWRTGTARGNRWRPSWMLSSARLFSSRCRSYGAAASRWQASQTPNPRVPRWRCSEQADEYPLLG